MPGLAVALNRGNDEADEITDPISEGTLRPIHCQGIRATVRRRHSGAAGHQAAGTQGRSAHHVAARGRIAAYATGVMTDDRMAVSGAPAGAGPQAGSAAGPVELAQGAGGRATPQREPDRPAPGARWPGRAAVVVLAAVVLFVCYWRQSLTQPISSDGAANALQAWDMLHGNLLLHGWLLSDVSFYTTELPQYMLIEAVRGLGPEVVNLAAAMTYTLLVLLAGLLAKGNAGGREGLARFGLAAGIVLAPQLSATSTLLQAPDHTGTAVALLVVWLVIDRARPHWLVPGGMRDAGLDHGGRLHRAADRHRADRRGGRRAGGQGAGQARRAELARAVAGRGGDTGGRARRDPAGDHPGGGRVHGGPGAAADRGDRPPG